MNWKPDTNASEEQQKNALLISGGYEWSVIPVERKPEYMKALEKASIEVNITG